MATQAQLDALDKAIAAGIQTVRHGDESITYVSMDDLLKARATVAAELNGTDMTTRRTVAAFSKGL